MQISFDCDKSLLIVAPHPDDETIGAGGILSKYGQQCDILVLTDGSRGVWPGCGENKNEIISMRRKEFEEIAKFFKIRKFFFLDIPDQELKKHLKRVYAFDLSKYDAIFYPSRDDRHIDHRAANRAIRKMVKMQRRKSIDLYEYEVWTPLKKANCYIDISEVIEKKKIAAKMYSTQLLSYDYCQLINGLAEYRGAIERKCFAEAYYSDRIANKRKIEKAVFAVWAVLPGTIRHFIKRVWTRNDV